PSLQFASAGNSKAKNPGKSRRNVRIADGRLIDKSLLEIRPNLRHEIQRVRSTEAAVHTLPMLQRIICNLHAAHDRLLGIRGKSFKGDSNGGRRGERRTD